jgi:DNA-directed RNA polymerase specialized sigma24 family protein
MMEMGANESSTEVSDEARYDRAAFLAHLFDQNFFPLRRVAFALVGEATAAEEITQEAFVRLYASWRRLDRIDDPRTFLRRIVVNLCRSRGRRLGVSRRLDPLLEAPPSVTQPDVALRLDVLGCIEVPSAATASVRGTALSRGPE